MIKHSVHLIHVSRLISVSFEWDIVFLIVYWIHVEMLVHLVVKWIVRSAGHFQTRSLLMHLLTVESVLLL
jgi:hypothetical protein